MKKKITKLMGIGLSFVLVASLMVVFAPVAAAADYTENDWKEWGLAAIEPDTDVGPMAIAPDGTIFAAVFNADSYWMVQKSEDGGFTWDDTELEFDGDDNGGPISQIVISPNYDEDETLYVAVFATADGPVVYRLEEAGDESPKALKTIVDSGGEDANVLFSIDVWYSERLDYNLILAGTDRDCLLLEDMVTGFWIDQELPAVWSDLTGDYAPAYEVNFAPDFEDEELIWAVTESDDGDFLVTSTIAPGRWGQWVGPAEINGVNASIWVDMDFPDDYTSDVDEAVPTVFVGLSAWPGDVYMIEGIKAADSVATPLEVANGGGANIVSLAISGDIILAGELESPEIYISDDLGGSWDDVTKMPTGGDGDAWTHVYMAPGDFDPDEGVAYASTYGDESAVSRSRDGGEVWNQIGLIDTYIDEIDDIAFHPDFPGTPTFMMTTDCRTGTETDSVWLTENGDEEEPDYIRVLCGSDQDINGSAPGNFLAEKIRLVEFSPDGDAIYIFGADDDWDSSIWKSTNDGQTFSGKRPVAGGGVRINDWEIYDSSTIYAATDDGFAMTINSGLSWTTDTVGSAMNDIALQPGFDPDDDDMDAILLGSRSDGDVFVSLNGGDTWKDTGVPDPNGDTALDGDVWVAFDMGYADEDADGHTLIYAACDNGYAIIVGEEDGVDTEWDPLEDDTNKDDDAWVIGSFYGLVVAEDNALYAIADSADYDWDDEGNGNGDYDAEGEFEDVTGVVRLLLHATNSLWEAEGASDLADPEGLWLSTGSNVLWTIDWDDDELWVLEDTCSGAVTLDSPADGFQSDRETIIHLVWDEVRDADEYQYKLDETSGLGTDIDDQTDDTDVNVSVVASSEYDWKVRVAVGEPWHSRWSSSRTFNTALGDPGWMIDLYAPSNGADDVLLIPAFSWETAKNADSYQYILADNPGFSSPLVNQKVPDDAFTPDITLDNDTTYYWKVMAYKGTKAISRWSEVSVFTTKSPAAPAPPAPAPPATITQPAPAPIVLPTPIPPALLWSIIGIGALLIIAVIVLIIRTRRPI